MHYHIYCNQKNISVNHQDALAEFTKRLSAYCNISLTCKETIKLPKEFNQNNHRILYVGTGPSTYSSEEFATCIQQLQMSGQSNLHVFIGYTETAFYETLSQLENYSLPDTLSLTKSSLSAQTEVLLFYEQLYRGYTILQGKTYHK
jgi:23S rRNA (pseudouridine1915-N3)-methyltransferase